MALPITVGAIVEEGLQGIKVLTVIEVAVHPHVHQLKPHPAGLEQENSERKCVWFRSIQKSALVLYLSNILMSPTKRRKRYHHQRTR